MNEYWDIKDDEIRVVGSNGHPPKVKDASMDANAPMLVEPIKMPEHSERVDILQEMEPTPPSRNSIRIWPFIFLAILLIAGLVLLLQKKRTYEPEGPGLYESSCIPVDTRDVINEEAKPFGDYTDTTGFAYTEVIETTVNDIPLSLYIPHNATPELCLRTPDYNNKDIILATQAADIRGDNYKIVGSFVLKGEPLAWGLSKKGYCGIIDGRLIVGVADNSPLFEQATETGGYFFRQFPLVDNGELCENELKNKSIRKALCEHAGEVFVVKSETPESFHDFAQALVDMGVNNAIYLVGSTSYGFWYDKKGAFSEFSDLRVSKYKYESYILWRKNE